MLKAWVIQRLKPWFVLAGQDICDKDDRVSSLFIFMSGSCGYVCQSRYNRFKFIDFHIGYIFGLIDILASFWGHQNFMSCQYS